MKYILMAAAFALLAVSTAVTAEDASPPPLNDKRVVAPQPMAGNPHQLPPYPMSMVRADASGTTDLSFVVRKDGTTSDIQIAHSSGWKELDQASADAVAHWRYQPATRDGQPMDYPWKATIDWKTWRDFAAPPGNSAVALAGITGATPAMIDLTQSQRTLPNFVMPNWHRRPFPDNNWPRIMASGKAAATFVVADDGSIKDVKIVESSGRAVFDSAFATFIGQQRFEPATFNDTAVAVRLKAVVDLEGDFGKVSILGNDPNYDECLSADPQVAISGCTKMIAAGCYCGAIRLLRARAYIALGRDNDALADLDAPSKLHGGDISRLKGFINEKHGDYQKAIDSYTDAMDVHGPKTIAMMDRGLAYAMLGRNDLATADFKAAAESNCGKSDCKPSTKAAIAALDQRIAQNPDDVGAFADRCIQRSLTARELSMTLADCNHVLARMPDEFNTLEARGLVFLRMGQYADAIQDFDAAVAAQPKRAASLYLRGIAKLRSGDVAAAHADFIAAREANYAIAANMASNGVLPL